MAQPRRVTTTPHDDIIIELHPASAAPPLVRAACPDVLCHAIVLRGLPLTWGEEFWVANRYLIKAWRWRLAM